MVAYNLAKVDARVRFSLPAPRITEGWQNGKYIPHRTPHTEEMKKYLANKMNDRYAAGWEPTCGRCKKYNYTSPKAGVIKVDGTWELTLCCYLDALELNWYRNKKRFAYTRPDGRKATYQPDFLVEEWGGYVEVKGYETDLDRCKWAQFPEPLKILRKKDIGELLEWLLERFAKP